jgi:MFS transporter, OFA family, oxalate/formate antiporter
MKLWEEFPFAPRRLPFFYGWIILVLGVLGFLMSAPGQTYGVSPFIEPLLQSVGLTRGQLSLAYMIGTIASALCITTAGTFYDRHGARIAAGLASLLLGTTLVLLSLCDRMAGALGRLTGLEESPLPAMAVLTPLFFLLRFSGQGVLTMVSRNMMMKWFDRHRGLVTGLCGMVIAPSFSAAPALLHALVNRAGWRGAWLIMAAVIGLGFTAIVLAFFRDSAEGCGLLPDGPLANKSFGSKPPHHTASRQFTLSEARRTYSFWIFTLALALFGMHMTAMSFHAASFFESGGIDPDAGYLLFLYAALFSLVFRPLVGWLSDRLPLKILLIGMTAGIGIGSFGLSILREGLPVWIVIFGNGLCGSMFGTMSTITWPNFYGRRHLGAISGFSMAVLVFASAVGPWLYSFSRSLLGSYRLATLAVTLCAAGLAVLALRADNPQTRGAADG